MSNNKDTSNFRFENGYIPEPNSGCWLWLGYVRYDGYGEISARKSGATHRSVNRAHVFSYIKHKGPVPKGLIVRHTCDVRCCVNPDHLVVGTKKDNTRDAIVRGRFSVGESHWIAKFNNEQIRQIRNDPRKQREIAEDYGVCQMTICNVKRRKTWAHVV